MLQGNDRVETMEMTVNQGCANRWQDLATEVLSGRRLTKALRIAGDLPSIVQEQVKMNAIVGRIALQQAVAIGGRRNILKIQLDLP